jgi:hypothetical protein
LKRQTIASVTPTLAALTGVRPPEISSAEPVDALIEEAGRQGTGLIERCLVFCPDAIGTAAIEENPSIFEPLREAAPLAVPLDSVFPPKTPVCFASMFTGAGPETHGIRRYVQKVLECDTLFDALVRAGKRVAIATVKGSSMAVLFKESGVDIHAGADDRQVTARAVELIETDGHDLVIAYHQEYDDILHNRDLRSPEALAAMERHVAAFRRLVEACHSGWGAYARMMLFAPDHGAHVQDATGTGDHGEDIPEDMEVTHFAGLSAGENRRNS